MPARTLRPTRPSARAAAIVALLEHAENFPEVFTSEVQVVGLSERDAKLAHAIVEAAITRWLTIGVLIEKAMGRPWAHVEVAPKAALLCGCAQLLHLRRVPSFAAVHDTVAATKDLFGQGVAGFVNAGLRGVLRLLENETPASTPPPTHAQASELRTLSAPQVQSLSKADFARLQPLLIPRGDGSCLLLREAVFAPDPVQHAAALGGVPDGLSRRWTMRHSPAVAASLCLHALCDAPVTLNIEQVQPSVRQAAIASGVIIAHTVDGHAAIAEQTHSAPAGEVAPPLLIPITKHLSDLPGAFVQDAASGVPVRFAAQTLHKAGLMPSAHDLVIDLCAGNGTKSRQIMGMFSQAGSVLATDPDSQRFQTLTRLPMELANAQQRGAAITNPGRLSVQPFENVRSTGPHASLVLLDVPCSNTGVLPRRPEARLRWLSRTQEQRMIELQRTILRNGLTLLRPGGVLLYATCSLEEEENQAQAAWAEKNLGLHVLGMEATLPTGEPGEAGQHYRDASFAVLLQKAV